MATPPSPSVDEKHHEPPQVVEVDEASEALNGYVLDPKLYPNDAAGLKLTADGKYVLIPQPEDSPDDPLNWAPSKKWLITGIIAYIAALADYTGGTAIVTVIPQSMQWHITQYHAQQAIVGNIFMIGACGLVVVMFANYFGRLPVALLWQAIALGTAAWSAAATTFPSYMAARILNGFFCSVGQGGALMWIKDLWFFHEHPRVINYVEFSIILSPYLGPLITAFIVYKTTWPWAFWLCTILWGIGLVLLLFIDETLYDRHVPVDQRVPRGPQWQRTLGIEQAKGLRNRSLIQSVARPVIAIAKIPVFLVLVFYFLNFAWVIGVNTTISLYLVDYYGFNTKDIGFFYFFGVVGVLAGWFAGHWLHDLCGTLYAARNNGRIDPEARLIITYPATILLTICLIIIGLALQNHWHYMVLAVFAALQCVGVMIVTTAINAYLLDCYPEGSGEVSAWVTASRNWSGFMATYIQIPWVTRIGASKAFGIQAAITFASIVLIILLQVFGKRIRNWQGRMVFGMPGGKA